MEEICPTCLSGQRSLHRLCNLEPLYKLLLPEITEDTSQLAVCWECVGILRKCFKFRRNVLKARDVLERFKRDLVKSKDGVERLKSLSSLRKYTKTKIDFKIGQYDPTCGTDHDIKLVLEIETESATDVKIETPDECESEARDDPLVEEIFVEPAAEYGFDDDSEEEVLSKVKVKMKKSQPESDEAGNTGKVGNEVAGKEGEEKRGKRTVKLKKRGKKVAFKAARKRKEKKDPSAVVPPVEGEGDPPSRAQLLDMFTSIEFCKNHFDVDGNNAEVLVMTEAEMKARRAVLREDSTFADAKYKCKSCIIGYEDKRRLWEHNAVNHVERPGEKQCRVCLSYVPEPLLPLHRGRHQVLFRCVVCGFLEDSPLPLLSHLRHHATHKGSNYCWMCKTNFRNPRGLRLHKEKVHDAAPREFRCQQCGKTFGCSIYYRDHLKRHAYQPVPCKICGKVCKSASAHSFHMKAHATVLSGEKFKCVECDIDFAQPVLLKNHFQTRKHMHPSEFKHICDACGKGFLWASNLQEHVNYVHRKRTDHVCTLCDKMFVSARCMRNHVKLVHEGHKPKKNKECNICGKRFAGKKTLTDHMNTHTGVRPYACEECGDTFKQAAALFTHRRLVHRGYRKPRRAPQPAREQATL